MESLVPTWSQLPSPGFISCFHCPASPPPHSSQDPISSLFNPLQCNHSPWGSMSLCDGTCSNPFVFSPPFIRYLQYPSGVTVVTWDIGPSRFRLTERWLMAYPTTLSNLKSWALRPQPADLYYTLTQNPVTRKTQCLFNICHLSSSSLSNVCRKPAQI